MPIFEYTCAECGHDFEKLIMTHKQEGIECPKCGCKRLERLFSAFATTTGAGKSAGASCPPSGGA
jgi:putative FmdB family regulatory protein